MNNIVKFDRVHKTIVLYRDLMFTSNFWIGLLKLFETILNLNTKYHPKREREREREREIKNMLRMCVM